MSKDFKILVVDDELAYCDALTLTLETEGYQVLHCTEPKKVAEILQKEKIDLIVSDLIMPEMNGVELLKEVKKVKPDIYFIVLTAFGTIDNAVEAMRYGAFTYVIKGSDLEKLLKEVAKIAKLQRKKKEIVSPNINEEKYTLKTENQHYKEVLNLAGKAARSDANILILGESGVGKEIIAEYIYNQSNRSGNKFVVTNCHTFSNTLLESELFGHEKGSFTGAIQNRVGLFETSQSGTLFLDEIGDIPLETQAKLLRTIEAKKITRIGSNDEIAVDFRLITATNKNLKTEIEEGLFREDLFYRISTIIIEIPPLRQRREDISHFIDFFLNKTCKSLGVKNITFPDKAMEYLMNYHYPGNIRELKNIIERLVVLSDEGEIREELLSELLVKENNNQWDDLADKQFSLKDLRHELESKYISTLLRKNMFNIPKTAEILGISTRHLFNKISEYEIKTNSESEEN